MKTVEIVIVDGILYAKTEDGRLLSILVDTYDCPVYGQLKVVEGNLETRS